MKHDKIYLTLVGIVFAAFALVFDTFPRPRYSELEKAMNLSRKGCVSENHLPIASA